MKDTYIYPAIFHLEEDKIMDQMTLKEYFDPFNVEKK